MAKTKFSYELITFLSGFSGFTAYAAILFVLLVCGLGVPIPEDITLVSAGILAALGNISLTGAMIVGFVGVLIGDTFLFFVGRRFGYRVFSLPVFRSIFTEKRILMARKRIISNSRFICFTARFLPGLRAPIYLTAGIMGVKPIVFFLLDGLAALLSVPLWVYLGWYFGSNLDEAVQFAFRAQKYIVLVVAVVIALYVGWIIYRKRTNRDKNDDEDTEPPKSPDQSPQI